MPHSNKTKLAGLDHLRALAITMVFFFHYRLFAHPAWIDDVVGFGWTGVDLFFVLSGYLISSQLFAQASSTNSISLKEFYLKRTFRIIPAYLTVVAIYFLVPYFREKEALPPLWKFLTFTQNLGLDRQHFGTFSHAWSLCVEEHFYLVLPLTILIALHFKAGKKAFWLLPILFILGFAIRLSGWFYFVEGTEDSANSNAWLTWLYYPTYNRLDGLLVGVSIAGIFQFLPKLKEKLTKFGNWMLVISLAILVAGYFLTEDFINFQTAVFGFPLVAWGFGCIVISAISPGSILYKHSSVITAKLAAWSYSLYLVHKGTIHIAQDQFEKLGVDAKGNLMIVLCIITSLAGAVLLHYIVEKPFLKLRDKILKNRKRKADTSVELQVGIS